LPKKSAPSSTEADADGSSQLVGGVAPITGRASLGVMSPAARILAEAMQLPEAEREELAATLLDSLEPPLGISIQDRDEIERRAEEARRGEPGIPWSEVKRNLSK
jgi:putative addiction module component (TIGR02574 family)